MTIRRIERGQGKPTVRTMYLLAEEFDLRVTDLWPIEERGEVLR